MSLRTSQSKREEIERQKREAARHSELAAALRGARAAKLAVALWNVRVLAPPPLAFYPTFRAALTAKRFFLACRCPACRTTGCIDLRTIDRHPDASIESIIPQISCGRCVPNPPLAKIIGLRRRRISARSAEPQA